VLRLRRWERFRLGPRSFARQSFTFGLTRVRMAGVGAQLQAIRRQWRLSLREVEQRSHLIAQQRGDLSYQVSASWLARLESDEHELTVNKLIALAEVYGITTDRLLHSIYPGDERPLVLDQLASPNETFPDRLPDETTLVPASNGPSRVPYRVGIIGRVDLTLEPVIPAGSIVQIDTSKREISPKKDWTHEFQRPIYFLLADWIGRARLKLRRNADLLHCIKISALQRTVAVNAHVAVRSTFGKLRSSASI
jgi:transcriptional regulator with XRE-family HTH domain